MRIIGVALMAVPLGGAAIAVGVAQAQAQPEAASEEAPSPADDAKTPARPARSKVAGWPVPASKLRATAPPRPSGNIHLHHVFHDETLKINIFKPDGSYDPAAVKAVTHLLRCTRTGTESTVDPRLLSVLSHVYDHFGGRRIEVTSGYRNQRKTTSYHYRASATDIIVPGVKPTKVRAFVETLDPGGMGIGLYPRAGFVHVDMRPAPSYRRIDNNAVDPDDPARLPPKGWKKKAAGGPAPSADRGAGGRAAAVAALR